MTNTTEQMEFKNRWKAIIITISPTQQPPFDVDAKVFEEDTYLALSADPEFRPSKEHPVRVLSEAYAVQPEHPGTVVVKSGRPLRLLAIVHKLDEEPTWREEWVASALEAVFVQAEKKGLRAVSLPILGTVHGKMEVERSLELLADSLHHIRHVPLDRIWLMPGYCAPQDISIFLAKKL